jgi:hypothetical protein
MAAAARRGVRLRGGGGQASGARLAGFEWRRLHGGGWSGCVEAGDRQAGAASGASGSCIGTSPALPIAAMPLVGQERCRALPGSGAAPALELRPDPIRRESLGRFLCGVRTCADGDVGEGLGGYRGASKGACAERTGRQRQWSGSRAAPDRQRRLPGSPRKESVRHGPA